MRVRFAQEEQHDNTQHNLNFKNIPNTVHQLKYTERNQYQPQFNTTQLKDIVFSLVCNFMADFRGSLIQELTQMFNSSSEINSLKLQSNLEYFREELLNQKSSIDKCTADLNGRIDDLENSLTSVMSVLDQRGLFATYNSKETLDTTIDNQIQLDTQQAIKIKSNTPDFDLRIDVTAEDIKNFEKSKKSRQKINKKSNGGTLEAEEVESGDGNFNQTRVKNNKSSSDLCNFSSYPTEEDQVHI